MNLRYYKLKCFVVVVLTVAALCAWLADIGIPNQVLKYLSPTFIITVFIWGFDKWFWKWPVFSFLMNVPNVSGHYTGQIEFTYNEEKRTKDCTMDIRQSSMRVDVETNFIGDDKGEPFTSSSSLIASIVQDERKGRFRLVFLYENQGSCVAGDTLQQHYGTNVLDIKIGAETIDLEGYYYTNRKPVQTMGKMKVSKQRG